MKKLGSKARRFLALVLSVTMILGLMSNAAFAEEAAVLEASTTSSWEKIALDDITATDAVAITMTTKAGDTYALASATSSGANAAAKLASVNEDTMTIGEAGAGYTWFITKAEDGSMTIKNSDGSILSTTSTASTRVKDEAAVWTLNENGYLTTVYSDVTKYLGVYTTKPDWRAYPLSGTGLFPTNIKDQTLSFWKFKEDVVDPGEDPVDPPADDITKLTPSATASGDITAGSVLTLQVGTISDATYEISTDNVTFTAIEGNTYTVPEGEAGSYTLYFRAVRDGAYSQVLSLPYTIAGEDPVDPPADDTDTIAAARAKAVGETATVAGVVTYISGKNVYIADETGGICLYFSAAPSGISVGSAVKATGTRAAYNGLEELTLAPEACTVTGTGTASVKTVTLAELLADVSTGALECTRVRIENVKLGDVNLTGNTAITDNDNNTINIYKGAALSGYEKNDIVSITATVGDFKGYQLYVLAAEDITLVEKGEPDPVDPPEEEPELPAVITEGTYVLWNPEYKITMADLTNGSGYYIGDSVTGDLSAVNGYTNASVWTVKAVEGGYTLETSGKYLGLTAANKLVVSASPAAKVWAFEVTKDETTGKSYYYVSCGEYKLEWFSKYSDWSVTKSISSGSENLFRLWLTPAVSVFEKDTEITDTVAQWGGSGPYTTGQTVINGDSFVIGDQLAKNAEFTAYLNGKQVSPFTTTTPTTGGTTYYMSATGLGSGTDDYMLLTFPTAGYGNLDISFRLRASNTGSGAFQVQYSTDGTTYKNLTTGSYECSYTSYTKDEEGNSVGTPVTLTGAITDGIAKTSIKAATYVKFAFDLPAGAENAQKLYVRLVAGKENAKGSGTAASGGVVRMDNVVVKGNPIVDSSITGFVTVDPDGVEEDQAPGTELSMSSATEGAEISYRFYENESTGWSVYNEAAKPVLPETLPAILQVKASKAGLADSITRTFVYSAGTVASVKVSPNGGGIYTKGGDVNVTLSCDTDGAEIRYTTTGKDGVESEEKVYSDETPIVLAEGFEAFTVKAYAVKEGFKDSAVTTRKFTERSKETYDIYFGQMHSHTSYSDGAGSADDAFKHASGVANLDFLAVTDHSNSFDNAGSAVISEDASAISTEWKEGKELAKQYTTDEFVGLFGYEMTWSNGLGHINTFNTPGFQSRTQSEYSTYATALQNYYAALKTVSDSISQFNHPGTTFGDFSDFAHFDTELDQLITLIEVGNGEGTIGSSSYFPSYEYYTRALDKGWHVAPTNNQDNHKGYWGDANTARSVVLTDSLSEEDIYDAMRNYRVYATEDNDLSIYYTLNDQIMGTILSKDDVDDTLTLQVTVSDPTDSSIGKAEVIVNGGLSIASKEISGNSDTITFNVGASYSYYYIKITEPDGDIAVTAPVWVGSVEALGISTFTTSKALQVQNEAIDLNVELYNNETKPFTVTSIEFSVQDAEGISTEIYTVSGEELVTAGIDKIAKLSTGAYSYEYTYSGLGATAYYVTVKGELNGVEKVFTEKLDLNYVSPDMVTNVVIDGTHYNDYVTGYYGGNMGNFTKIAADSSVKVTIAGNDKDAADRSLTEDEWKALLADCAVLVVSAPARTNGTANAGDYKASAYEDWFLALVKDYVDNGGSVIVCGLADYQDKKAGAADNHCAAQQNKLLEAIGSSLKINDDEICDDTNNGGQNYRMYPESFNMDAIWTEGITDKTANPENYQKYSQYSGCSVDAGNGTWLVQGFDTTYSIDSDGDKIGGITLGSAPVYFMATETTAAGGNIFAAGGVFLSDFEIKVEMDNQFDLPYANKTIAENILASVKKELPITPISEVREAANAGENGSIFRVKGSVTAGRSNPDNAFFDCIYLQDDTAGIDIFPISDDSIQVGAVVEVTGYIASYQGDLELKVMSYEIIDNENLDVKEPTLLACKDASDYENYGGLLIKVEGTVKEGSLYYNADDTLAQFVVVDETGETTIFIDGYILSGTTGTNDLAASVKEGCKVSAVGVQYMHPEIFVPGVVEPVSVLRVRNCDEIIAEEAPEEPVDVSDIFTDVPKDAWYHDYVQFVYDNGLMTGMNETTFSPNSNLSRAQFVTILYRASGSPEVEFVEKFPDVKDGKFYSMAVMWATENGIVKGYDNGNFGPNDEITREQMAVMMFRFAKSQGMDTSARASLDAFTDAGKVSKFAKEEMAWAVAEKIISGKTSTTLDPQGKASRAQCATIMARFYGAE